MPKSHFNIKLKGRFTLYVLLKDKELFESEIRKHEILFYTDIEEQPLIDGRIRFFLLDSDMEKIDQIIIENGITAHKESYLISDFRSEKKIMKISILIAISLIAFIILLSIIEKY